MKRQFLILWIILALAPVSISQDETKIQQLFQDAIQAMGGDAYLNVTDIVSEGHMFAFNAEGASSIPVKYNDYTKFPDKSRFEFGNGKKDRDITVFNLGKNEGWILEGQKGTRDATAEEMREFKNAVRHSLDMIFRFRYKDPENKLFYLGPGEGKDATLEVVKLVDPENDEVTIYFDRISKLPAKLEYRETNDRGVRLRHVEEFSRWHMKQGILTSLRSDRYVNGRKSTQQFVLKITYNNNLPDSFFSKPVPPK
ncbi:MAG: hypothetical protein JXA73_04705 [Acidobacteria bacterium]|nr:hypothetical protein [Acidobacteriota bacterium]